MIILGAPDGEIMVLRHDDSRGPFFAGGIDIGSSRETILTLTTMPVLTCQVLPKSFLGDDAAVLAKSRGQRTAWPCVEQTSRRRRAGRDLPWAEERRRI